MRDGLLLLNCFDYDFNCGPVKKPRITSCDLHNDCGLGPVVNVLGL